jgi:hypothetical protein
MFVFRGLKNCKSVKISRSIFSLPQYFLIYTLYIICGWGSIPDDVMWVLWWIKFSPSILFPHTTSHITNCFMFTNHPTLMYIVSILTASLSKQLKNYVHEKVNKKTERRFRSYQSHPPKRELSHSNTVIYGMGISFSVTPVSYGLRF